MGQVTELRNCSSLVTWFCYQLIAKPGNKTATVPWPDPDNGLLPDGTKPLPEPKVTNISEALWHSPKCNTQEMFKISILDMTSKITDLRLQLHLPGTNQFTYWGLVMHQCKLGYHQSSCHSLVCDNGLASNKHLFAWTNHNWDLR